MSERGVELVPEDRPFSGALGIEYDFIKQICPNVPVLHARISALVAARAGLSAARIVELGCGTGLLTAALLAIRDSLTLTAVDSEPVMLEQARANLHCAIASGRLTLTSADALRHLSTMPSGSTDIIVSAYCIHNFDAQYRRSALQEIFRTLKPGGLFINGDRYALDDPRQHTPLVQREVAHFFKIFRQLQRLDLLEQWLLHLLADEAPDRVMREGAAIKELRALGFEGVQWHYRDGIDGLLAASKSAAS